MNSDTKFLIGGVLAILAFLGLVFWISMLVNTASCNASWKDSGFENRFSLLGGCQIKLKDGTWIPAVSYREVP